jgi:hypothetical protein
MQIVTYFDQLKTAARQFGENPDQVLLHAFVEAGLPTSTFYRARKGTDLRGDKARRVAQVLFKWAKEGVPHESREHPETSPETDAAADT